MGGLFGEISGSKKRIEVIKVLFYSALCGCLCSTSTLAQTGSIHEPVRYVGGVTIDPNVHEGRLRYANGLQSMQTLRVNRTHPELADDHGWTYNHASNLPNWNGTFYQQHLSNPI